MFAGRKRTSGDVAGVHATMVESFDRLHKAPEGSGLLQCRPGVPDVPGPTYVADIPQVADIRKAYVYYVQVIRTPTLSHRTVVRTFFVRNSTNTGYDVSTYGQYMVYQYVLW